ncbi:hypothetical protein [Curtobacterium sp. 9128]|uniref:hypothetical protein n=1 Tax=Curtobacterium sp. 9128 TaxID=1793722 RepID=UPI0011A49705|nr:hypothetical protein [Curtobacterium sp. 9128]
MPDLDATDLRSAAAAASATLVVVPMELRKHEARLRQEADERLASAEAASTRRRRSGADHARVVTQARTAVTATGARLTVQPQPPADLPEHHDGSMVDAALQRRADEVRAVFEALPALRARSRSQRRDAIALPIVGALLLFGILSVLGSASGWGGFFDVLTQGAVTGLFATIPVAVVGGRFFHELAGGRTRSQQNDRPKRGVWFAFRLVFGLVCLVGGLTHLDSFGMWIIVLAAAPLIGTSAFRVSRVFR